MRYWRQRLNRFIFKTKQYYILWQILKRHFKRCRRQRLNFFPLLVTVVKILSAAGNSDLKKKFLTEQNPFLNRVKIKNSKKSV
jgi:hypothetical protein